MRRQAGQPISVEVQIVEHTPQSQMERAAFACGCYWGPELHFQRVPGVVATSVGFCNGKENIPNPSYEAVCSGQTGAGAQRRCLPLLCPRPRPLRYRGLDSAYTCNPNRSLPLLAGYAEAVEVFYDPKRASFDDLLAVFWEKHDPTQVNRQGNDVGTQYRSGIYATTEGQLEAAKKGTEAAQARFSKPIASEIAMLKAYTRGPEEHQQYLAKGGRFGKVQSPAKQCNDPVRCYG